VHPGDTIAAAVSGQPQDGPAEFHQLRAVTRPAQAHPAGQGDPRATNWIVVRSWQAEVKRPRPSRHRNWSGGFFFF